MIGLDQTAVVYTPHATTGDYTVTANASLACRLAHITTGQVEAAQERGDVSHRRRLLWGTAYTMPTTAQVLIAGQRWNVEPQTIEQLRGPSATAVYQRCTVVIAAT